MGAHGQLEEEFVEQLVAELRSSGALRSRSVERAFRGLRRHWFLPTFYAAASPGEWVRVTPGNRSYWEQIYSDRPIVIRVRGGIALSSASLPSLVAEMLELLELREHQTVLEVGAGSGYNAALLAAIVGARGSVTTYEVDPELAAMAAVNLTSHGISNVRVVEGDGGRIDHIGPFDRLVVTVGCEVIPTAWIHALRENGRAVIPVVHRFGSAVLALERVGQSLVGRARRWTYFVPAQGALAIGSKRLLGGGGLPERAESFAGPLDGDALAGFQLYLAIRDPRACVVFVRDEPTFGLRDSAGWAAVLGSSVVGAGDAALCEALSGHLETWARLNRPTVSNFVHEIASADVVVVPAGETLATLDRGGSVQRVSLDAGLT